MGGDEIELVARFISIYKDDLLPEQTPPDLGDITEEDVAYAIDHGGNSAGGADLWNPRELQWLGKTYCKWLAVVFNMAEKGLGWPMGLRCARSAYISKEEEPNIRDLLKYRVITVLPSVYRIWSNMRYRTLQRLVRTMGRRRPIFCPKAPRGAGGMVDSELRR